MPPFSRRRCLLALLAAATAGLQPRASWARPARDRLPLQLALEAPAGMAPAGYLVSEKYDGVRAVWDGAVLRFRSGLPVAAPGWFLRQLPGQALDGELWLGRGRFEALSGLVRRAQPDEAGWRALRYMVFDQPGHEGPFERRAERLRALVQAQGVTSLVAVPQFRCADRAALQRALDQVLAQGGEGLMLHRADAPHVAGRSGALLKLKPLHDAEAQVIAHEPGRGRHQGRLGALRVRSADGTVFALGTGFSDAQREQPPAVGRWVTYSHRGHTAAGVPRFASFLRERDLP